MNFFNFKDFYSLYWLLDKKNVLEGFLNEDTYVLKYYANEALFVYSEIYFFFTSVVYLCLILVFNFFIISRRIVIVLLELVSLSYLSIMVIELNKSCVNFLGYNSHISSDFFVYLLKLLLLLSICGTLFIISDYFKYESIYKFELIFLIIFSSLGMFMLLLCNDFIMLFLAIELQGLCFYAMSSIKYNSNYSVEAGLKYIILGAFSSGVLLFGMSLVYGHSGLINFNDLAFLFMVYGNVELVHRGIFIGMAFILISLCFKLGVAPFHMWVPDVYEGSPTAVTAFFAIVSKISVLGVLVRLYYLVGSEILLSFNYIFIYLALVSLVVGTFSAFNQRQLKRILAFSGVSHIGFMLMTLVPMCKEGLVSLIFYIFIYMVLMLHLFGVVLSFRNRVNGRLVKLISGVVKMIRSNNMLSVSFCFGLFSVAAIPPLLGFYSKFYVFMAMVEYLYIFFSGVVILLSSIGVLYYIRLIKIMYFLSFLNYSVIFLTRMGKLKSILLSYLNIVIVLFFLYPTPLLLMFYNRVLLFSL